LTVLATGSPPLSYQWQFNSNTIPGEYGDTLRRPQVAPADFGAYRVIVSNAFGSVTSSNALLQLDSDGDGLADSWEITYFGNITNYTGLDDYDQDHISNLAEFREGTAPKSFSSADPRLTIISDRGQVFVTPNLPFYTNGQTVTLLALPDPGQEFLGYLGAGIFSSTYNIKTNPASLKMTDSQTVRAIFGLSITNSLDVTNGWRIDQAGWYGQTNVTHDGVAAVQSAQTFSSSEQAVLELTNVMSGEGTITFWWKVDGTPRDSLFFWLNNSLRSGAISSNTDWQLATYYLPAGTNRIRWIYAKGGNEVSEYNGLLYAPVDAGWVDEVKFQVWSNPLLDTDRDGLPDLWELKYFDSLAARPGDDPDGDGISNLDEYLDHTDPTISSSSLPRLTVIASGGTIVRNPELAKYPYNQKVGLVAVPDPDNYFVIWGGAVSGTNITNSLNMSRNQSVTAVFGSPLASALETPSLAWVRGGTIGWYGQTNVTHDGVDAAQSGPVGSQQESSMQTTVDGPGALTFWWKVSSRTNSDLARFLVDGVEQPGKISGELDWNPQVYYLAPGNHTLRWSFTNSTGVFTLTNGCAWVDEVKFTTGSFAPEILQQPGDLSVLQGASITLKTVAAGSPAPTYQWFLNEISLGDAGTNATLTLGNAIPAQSGIYYAEVRNAIQTNASTAFTLTVLPVPPANDNYADRSVLSGTTESSGYDFGATMEPNEPNHNNQYPRSSVWWKWMAPATAQYRLVARSREIISSLVAGVYTGTAVDNLTSIGSSSQNASTTNGESLATVQIPFAAIGGTEYAIALGHTFGPAGYFNLQMQIALQAPLLGNPGFNSGGQFAFSFIISPYASYAIDTSTNLINWSLVATGTSTLDGTVNYVESPAQHGTLRFYRVRLP
jgi:hypothetical protein